MIWLLTGGVACGHQSPESPTRYGVPILSIRCDASGVSPLTCRAPITSCGLYDCAPEVPADVTTASTWVAADPAIVRVIAPGEMVAVAPGNTYVTATWQPNARASSSQTVSVFPGTAPLPTFEIDGTVYDAAGSETTTPINDAVIEIVNGVLPGRRVTAGMDPPPFPGFYPPPVSVGRYVLVGVPPGTHRVRVSKAGYVVKEQDVTIQTGSMIVNFGVTRQP